MCQKYHPIIDTSKYLLMNGSCQLLCGTYYFGKYYKNIFFYFDINKYYEKVLISIPQKLTFVLH